MLFLVSVCGLDVCCFLCLQCLSEYNIKKSLQACTCAISIISLAWLVMIMRLIIFINVNIGQYKYMCVLNVNDAAL